MANSNENLEMRAITVSREYGSGGGEVARRLASKLGWQLVDHEVVARVAGELGVTEEEADRLDEREESLVTRILSHAQGIEYSFAGMSTTPVEPYSNLYKRALMSVVESAAAHGKLVIVGRASQVILADRRDVLHLRVIAPFEQRVKYVALREQLSDENARKRTEAKDRDRTQYLRSQYNCTPDDPRLYDIVVNTGVLGIDSAVDLAMLALKEKQSKLQLNVDELGPASGMQPYPGAPADLKPVR